MRGKRRADEAGGQAAKTRREDIAQKKKEVAAKINEPELVSRGAEQPQGSIRTGSIKMDRKMSKKRAVGGSVSDSI